MQRALNLIFLTLIFTGCQSIVQPNQLIGSGPIALSSKTRSGYNEWLKHGTGAWAFAVSLDGSTYGYVYCKAGSACGGKPNAPYRSIGYCERRSGAQPCRVYALNGRVVWKRNEASPKLTYLDRQFSPVPTKFLRESAPSINHSQKVQLDKYLKSLNEPDITNGVFAISTVSSASGWQTWRGGNTNEAAERAIEFCEKHAGKGNCAIFAIDDVPVGEPTKSLMDQTASAASPNKDQYKAKSEHTPRPLPNFDIRKKYQQTIDKISANEEIATNTDDIETSKPKTSIKTPQQSPSKQKVSTDPPAKQELPISNITTPRRVALVVGNTQYNDASLLGLKNPRNDATDIATELKRQGFELIGGRAQLDLTRDQMLSRILDFGNKLGKETVGLFYYAGHGVSVDRENFLVPIDGNAKSKREVSIKLVSANHVMEQFRETGGGLNMMILDACRNTPSIFRGIRSTGSEGLAEMRAASGTLISYATQPGNVALDGFGRNSPFAEALIKEIRRPNAQVWPVFNSVSISVKNATNGAQVPWITSVALEGDFRFSRQ